jgi:ABC-type antimicrobial peptide transport system permease subunit
MVLVESAGLVIVGMAVGVPTGLGMAHLIADRLFQIGAADPVAMASAMLLMITVSAVAGFIPARRTARVDPMIALRTE